ncbi:cellular tumor antigen p53-like [Uloborus diversus]|uniref:cellular tumor antigen p53-like n=1 Tax=Uloborus diversus TaxID=327109 RepID=UPI0024096E39|nr:cellular tumor antigen p53-like [Uloborus diversus]
MPHSSNSYRTSLPASQNWPGEYEFTVSLESQEKSKSVAWTYSKVKNKLYVKKDSLCPISFSASEVLPSNAMIRATVVYSLPQHMTDVVRRCPTHSTKDFDKGVAEAHHLMRCESRLSSYQVDPGNLRHSVVVPFENPAAGQQHSTYLYKFTCFGSCSGGPNRKPLTVVFTLEKDNQVHGRRKLDVKICACPVRDRKSEESQLNKASIPVKRKEPVELISLSDTLEFTRRVSFPPSKKTKLLPNKDGQYILTVDDVECYEFLQQMKKFYDFSKLMKNLSPDTMLNIL